MSLRPSSPSTMLGIAAQEHAREREESAPPKRPLLRVWLRRFMAALALTIGLSGFTMGTAQAWGPFDDMKDNIASTIVNICGPNDVPTPTTYEGPDNLAGLNDNPSDGARATVRPNWKEASPGKGGTARAKLNEVYGDNADVIAPTYERYGFAPLQWNQYGYSCYSPTLMMGPMADGALMVMVKMPMMLGMVVLNFAMDNSLYSAFATMMNPFISQMYNIFDPWIYLFVGVGVFVAWLASSGSLQATAKAGAWGVFIIAVFLLMGQSTSKVVRWSTNIVTEVAGTAACGMGAAAQGDKQPVDEEECNSDDPVKSVNEALWYGVPYQTWLVGQIGEAEALKDIDADDGDVTWGAAILNANYLGTEIQGEGYERGGGIDKSGVEAVDQDGIEVMKHTEGWNGLPYTKDGKVTVWEDHDVWAEHPTLANVKIMCNDKDTLGEGDVGDDPTESQRWMFSGSKDAIAEDGSSLYCDSKGAGTTAMISSFKGEDYNKQFFMALAGAVGAGSVLLAVAGAAIYLAFQKMTFFFLLFLAPIVLTISAIGDRKRRPFAVRYAEIVGANLLKQIAAVCVVLFVSHAMASLFGSTAFAAIPWVTRPFAAALFFLSLVMLAFPLKSLIKGAVKGDTSSLDKMANAPANTLKTGGKVAAVGAGLVATGGMSGALGLGGAAAGAGGKAAMLGKSGTMLGQAGRVMGIGSKTGRAMRASGALLRTSQNVMESKEVNQGRKAALKHSAQALIDGPGGEKYRDKKTGELLPNAQKMAMKDAQKTAETGHRSGLATKAHDEQMAQFFKGVKAQTGQHHQHDPQSPENQRQERVQFMADQRAIKKEVDAAEAQSEEQMSGEKDPNPTPTPTPTPGEKDHPRPGPKPGDQNYMQHGGGQESTGGEFNTDSETETRPVDFNAVRKQYRDKAHDNLNGPGFARETDYNVSTVNSGEEVLRKNNLTKDDVLSDPTLLLRGDAYEGGATTKMDPFHPASAALNELRFASASGDEDAMEAAVAKSVDAIDAHGVPDHISGVHSIGDRSKSFEAIEVLGAMPTITPETTMSERAEAAQTMMAAQVAMPEEYQSREAVQDYTAALANPTVDPASLEAMQARAMTALNADVERFGPPTTEGGWAADPSENFAHAAPQNAGMGGVDPNNVGAFAAGAGAGYFMGNDGGQQQYQEPVQDYFAGQGMPPAPGADYRQEPVHDSFGDGGAPPQQYDGTPPQSGGGQSYEPVREQPAEGGAPAPISGEYQQPAPQEPQQQPAQPADYTEQPAQPADSYVAPPSEPAPADESPAQDGGMSRDEVRQAVTEGVRDAQHERSFRESPMHESPVHEGPVHGDFASADFKSADFSGDSPTSPTTPAGVPVPPSVPTQNHSAPSSGRGTGSNENTPPVEPLPEEGGDGPIIFRPTPRNKDEDEDDD